MVPSIQLKGPVDTAPLLHRPAVLIQDCVAIHYEQTPLYLPALIHVHYKVHEPPDLLQILIRMLILSSAAFGHQR